MPPLELLLPLILIEVTTKSFCYLKLTTGMIAGYAAQPWHCYLTDHLQLAVNSKTDVGLWHLCANPAPFLLFCCCN